METITLADGTVLEKSHVIVDENRLFFYIQNGMSMAAVFALMNDPEKTVTISALQYQQETVCEGYTDLRSISRDAGQISGMLQKP